jgi:hypothetical protein
VRTAEAEELATLLTAINAGERPLYGYLEVDVVGPEDLRFPILPERRSTANEVGKNVFCLRPKHEVVYYSEELYFAISRGYRITKLWSACVFERGPVYAGVIGELKKQKMLGEGRAVDGALLPGVVPNKSLREAAKIGSNSLYGKTLQNIRSNVTFVTSFWELWNIMKKKDVQSVVTPIYCGEQGDILEVVSKRLEGSVQKRSNAALGGAILAEARLVLYRYLDEVLAVGGEPLYCDTDSIIYSGPNELPETSLHSCRYGAMKREVELGAVRPGGFVALCPKTYALDMADGTPFVKCKGVSVGSNLVEASDGLDFMLQLMAEEEEMQEGVLEEGEVAPPTKRGLSFELLRDLVEGRVGCLETVNLQFLKTPARKVFTFDSLKNLRDRFDKRRLLYDGVTVPWTPFNESLADMDVESEAYWTALGRFLRHGLPEDICWYFYERWSDGRHVDFFHGWGAHGDVSYALVKLWMSDDHRFDMLFAD